ncbi:MAG TPA: hypothetical protein VMG82_02390, partial [Candidatus Sulfotelmatobacter sp.]|nr:hypothetical protein [Candidatus Sulfotelmatobacter sp.]
RTPLSPRRQPVRVEIREWTPRLCHDNVTFDERVVVVLKLLLDQRQHHVDSRLSCTFHSIARPVCGRQNPCGLTGLGCLYASALPSQCLLTVTNQTGGHVTTQHSTIVELLRWLARANAPIVG